RVLVPVAPAKPRRLAATAYGGQGLAHGQVSGATRTPARAAPTRGPSSQRLLRPLQQPREEPPLLRRLHRLRLRDRRRLLARPPLLLDEPLFEAHPRLRRPARLVGALALAHPPRIGRAAAAVPAAHHRPHLRKRALCDALAAAPQERRAAR